MRYFFTWLQGHQFDASAVLFLDVVIKATFLLLLAVAVNGIFRRRAAAVRHRVWCLAFCGLLALPLLTVTLPEWRLSILPQIITVAEVDATETSRTGSETATSEPGIETSTGQGHFAPPLDVDGNVQAQVKADAGAIAEMRSRSPEIFGGSVADSAEASLEARQSRGEKSIDLATNNEPAANQFGWLSLLFLSWFAGVFVAARPLLTGLVKNRTLRVNAQPADDESQMEWVRNLSESLGLRRHIVLLETRRAIAPMTWGVLRPIVMFPVTWREWSRQRQDFVLLHELAHVKRCDVAFQLIARFACALYWFHPLAWYALRRLRIERELACDDCVLMAAARPSEYARELVDIARSYQSLALPTTVAMAQISNLEERVRALLDQTRSHLPIGRTAGRLLLFGAILLVTSVAVVKPSQQEIVAGEERKIPSEVVPASANDPSVLNDKEPEADPTSEDDLTFHFRGRVLNPEGQPVAGARLFFVYWVHGQQPAHDVKPQAVTDADGWFDFTATPKDVASNAESAYARNFSFPLVATADGYGFAKKLSVVFETTGEALKRLSPRQREFYDRRYKGAERVFRLVKDDVPIRGRIVTTEGQPVPDAQVRIDYLWYNQEGNLDAWEAASHEEKADFSSLRQHTPEIINGPQLGWVIPEVTTDGDGRFTLRGIGRERVAQLVISGPAVETSLIKTRTRSGEPIRVPNSWAYRRRPDSLETYFPAEFTHVAAPSVPIVGRITDTDTGQPIPGVTVSAGQSGTFFGVGKPWISTATDKDGRYRLEGLPIDSNEGIYLFPPTDSAYLPGGHGVKTKLGEKELVQDVALKQGIWVRGQAIDDRTGQPLPGRVQYYVDSGNPHVEEYEAFARGRATHERRVDMNGRFAIPVMPGRGIVTFMPDDHSNYRRGVGAESITVPSREFGGEINAKSFMVSPSMIFSSSEAVLREVNPAVGSAPPEMILKPVSGIELVGKLFDPSGEQLTTGRVQVVGEAWKYKRYDADEHLFHVEPYFPDEPCDVFFYHVERNLAGHLHLEGKPPKELAVTLQPAGNIRGRLVDDTGTPLADIRLDGEGIPTQDYGDTDLRVATDGEGKFLIRGLIPGRKYTVEARGEGVFGEVLSDVSVDSAETKDVGDVTPHSR